MESGDGCNTMLALGLGFHHQYDHVRVQKNQRLPIGDQRGDDNHFLPSLTLGLSETAYGSVSEIFDRGMTGKYALGGSAPTDLTRERSSYSNCSANYVKISAEGDLQEAAELEKRPSLIISDEDEDCSTPRKKLRLSKEQISVLESSFESHSTLNPKQKEDLARQLCLRPRQVEVWFQNRRARIKLKQTEVDRESLKRRCEALREENRRLQEEVQELKYETQAAAIPPFLTQIPPTALPVMCPSCERVTNKSEGHLPTSFFSSSVTKSRLCDIQFPSRSAAC